MQFCVKQANFAARSVTVKSHSAPQLILTFRELWKINHSHISTILTRKLCYDLKQLFAVPVKRLRMKGNRKKLLLGKRGLKTHLQHKTFTIEVPCEPVEEPRTAAGAVRFLKHTAAKAQPIS